MEKDTGEIFRELKKDLSAYVELKLELLKLNTYERTGKVIAVLSYGVILLFLAFFAILFIFLALGFFLGDLFGSVRFGIRRGSRALSAADRYYCHEQRQNQQ